MLTTHTEIERQQKLQRIEQVERNVLAEAGRLLSVGDSHGYRIAREHLDELRADREQLLMR